MIRQALWLISLVVVAFGLAGCGGSLLESKKIDYKSAGKLPPLEIPPDLTTPTRDDRYAVPDITPRGTATYSVYSTERSPQAKAAAGSNDVLPQPEKTRIERSGSQRWLIVAASPDKVWPLVKEFWQELGFIVNLELPDAGIIETDWAENRAKIPQDFIRRTVGKVIDSVYSTPERDKFRTRLERGSEPGTTEIYISHRGMTEIYVSEAKDSTKWQPRPADPELEAEMLRRLMVRLGTEEDRARNVVATAPQEERAKLRRAGDGAGTLYLQEAFDRAWRRVGLALDRVGFTVEDRDRSQGVYYVRYVNPELDNKKEEPGLISKILFFWRTDPKKSAPPADPKSQYRIHVKDESEGSAVEVLTREGGVDNSESAKSILGLLYDQLK